MSFVTEEFILFIAVVFAVYFAVYRAAPKAQWTVLLAASWVFYAFASLKFCFFLLFSVGTTWGCALLTDKAEGKKRKKLILTCCLLMNIGALVVLKYTGLIMNLFGHDGAGKFLLPLGISFYTFQSAGYCVDVYRGKAKPERNFFRYALFVSYFPQISEGPIGRYGALAPQLLAPHGFSYDRFSSGMARAVTGAFKKLFVANTLASFVNTVYSSPESYSGIVLSAAAVFYTFQIYADFSGYIDMALGVSECLGISLAENFKAPDFAVSVNDFWKRWHISLTSWFRDYLYIPLGGNRKGTLRKYLNKMAVFLVSGLWHGADLSFLLWGGLHGAYVVAGEASMPWRNRVVKKLGIKREGLPHRMFCTVRTFALVTFAWIFFRADSISQALLVIRRIFSSFYYDGWSVSILAQYDIHYFVTVMIGLLLLIFIEFHEKTGPFSSWLSAKPTAVRWGVLYVLLLCLAYVIIFSNVKAADASNFIYFQF